MATEKDALRDLAQRWEREASGYESDAARKSADWTNHERRLLEIHARVKRACAQELRAELMKVRRGG